MKRDYSDGVKNDVIFFTGIEIEKTPAYKLKTLFVVGVQPLEEIINLYRANNCEHIYIGANHSFTSDSVSEYIWPQWQGMVKGLLELNILVTLDFDLAYLPYIQSSELCNYNNFIPQISVKIPNIKMLNYNTTLKIDDIDFNATNPGIWCHRLHDLQAITQFTGWNEYGKDDSL